MQHVEAASPTTIRQQFLDAAERAIVGHEDILEQLLVTLVAGGHVLLEGVPGTAKTLMARTLALLVRAPFARIQFTPDLLPSDIVGTSVFDMQTSRFSLRRGPVFTSILLADEINRAPAKTQSALLEAMEERTVTLDGTIHQLPPVFMVIATQNPVEYEGTYPLPEAQVDRFFMKLLVTHGDSESEQAILTRYHRGFDARNLNAVGLTPVLDEARILALRAAAQQVVVDASVIGYITTLVRATREHPDLSLGASPRAGIALLLGCKTLAALQGRAYIVPDDIKLLAPGVLRHRLLLRPEAELEGATSDLVIQQLLTSLPVPR